MSSIVNVSFSNPGTIDPRVWSTFGVSVKETDNAIGQFGTGLKYAIAVLMREGRSMSIKSAGKEYVFGVMETDIRGKEFEQITCNGDPLPFTTHLGAKWELWQAYRELYSNCQDEGGDIGEDGDTVITAEIGDIDHWDVFLSKKKRLLASSALCDIYQGSSPHIYYRGIRAKENNRESLFTYDIKKSDLTEDRTFKYIHQIDACIGATVYASDDTNFLYDFILQSKDKFEEGIDFIYAAGSPSQAMLDIVSQKRGKGIYIQKQVFSECINTLGAQIHETTEMDERQQRIVAKSSAFCAEIGYPVLFPVKLVTDMGPGKLAMADRKTNEIYLSAQVLDQGTKQVAATLIEENIHLQKGFDDCNYEMQNYLFDQIVTMGEKLIGEIL